MRLANSGPGVNKADMEDTAKFPQRLIDGYSAFLSERLPKSW